MSSTGTMRSRFPFTESQWEELEHQALIFKYIVSGIPVPPDLLFPIRRSSYFPSLPLPSKLFSRSTPHLTWNVYEMGVGRKIDPEPGRCRRTDGKKWRCSKEAYPDSKYCERHMHRGKNRSRKPVEFSTSSSAITSNRSTMSASLSVNDNTTNFSSLYSHTSGLRPLPGLTLSSMEYSGPYPYTSEPDHRRRRSRYMDENEGFFSAEASAAIRGGFSCSSMEDGSWGFAPLTINASSSSSYSPKQRNLCVPEQEQDKPDRHCFILGTDITHQMPLNFGKQQEGEGEEPNKRVHRFFDERPQENRESSSKGSSSVSTNLFI